MKYKGDMLMRVDGTDLESGINGDDRPLAERIFGNAFSVYNPLPCIFHFMIIFLIATHA
jgi:hypothetical protein